ncbi:MAG: hypothetical protein GY696_16440 [Gammaproteobacteria bacterium]|nr:hypothetical protein [Gammaproteobacteria bacterium]
MVRFSSIRVLLANVAQHGMVIHQMDVVTAMGVWTKRFIWFNQGDTKSQERRISCVS